MSCPECGAETLAFPVGEELRALLPDDRPGAAICTHCLHVTPADDPPADLPDFSTISDAFPRDREAAVALALVLALVDSLALYREELDVLLTRVEAAGTDPLLALDRLAGDPALAPTMDLDRRCRQLEQLV